MPAPTVTINEDQQLFVIGQGRGFSTYGFDNCMREAMALAEAVGRPDLAPRAEDRGRIEQYEAYQALLGEFARHPASEGTWYGGGTDPEVARVLEAARSDGTRIVITQGDVATGVAWDDKPVRGTVGRSTGITKVPLLIANARASGGGAISCQSVLRIQEAATGRDLYVSKVPQDALEAESEPSPRM